MAEGISWTFGELEAALASVHSIAPTKRTAFQSRLKNFHRLGYPLGFKGAKGKAAKYSPLQIIELALAMEMTQLGMPPERSSDLLISNRWPILMATELVARELHAAPAAWSMAAGLADNTLSMFLYFDPAALQPLMSQSDIKPQAESGEPSSSVFYVGTGTESEGIAGWASSGSARMSIINLTVMTASVVSNFYHAGKENGLENRRAFFHALESAAAKERANSKAAQT